MHNNIMAAGSRDHPPILQEVPERTAVETLLNMSLENKAHYQSEKEAIHLLLTGIRDEIYSTVDACKTAHDMWIAIERLHQGKSLNIQDFKTNLFWEFGRFTSRDGETMESYYSRFYKMKNEMIRNNLIVATMQVNVQFLQQLRLGWSGFVTIVKKNHDLDIVSYHKFFEVHEIHAERIAKNANPLALLAAAQQYANPYYQAPKSHKSYIAKPITTPSKSAFEEDSDPEQAQGVKDMQKNLALIEKNNNVDTSPRYKNDNQTRQFRNQRTVTVAGARDTVGSQECRKPKRVKDYTYHKEKMLLCKQAEKGVPLQAEQADWLEDTDEEIDEQELEAHYSYMAKIQEVPTADSGTDFEPLEKTDQNVKECDDECVALATLIANLKIDIDENKKIQKQLKKANASLTQELKECKSTLEETNRTLRESNSTRDIWLIALQNKQTELETYKNLNDRIVDYDKLERVTNRTSVSRPQLKSTQMKDKVMQNNSQVKVKKTQVEDHHRISSISNQTKSLTTCNDSLKSRTSNVNVPQEVPTRTRKPKIKANKSVATPPKKIVASESIIQKSKSYYRMLYEKPSKAWKWWAEQQCPSGYKWVPKTKMKWAPKVRKEDVNTIIMEYLVNISKRRAFWSLNEDILEINDSDYQYAVSIKEDTACPCLHSPKTTKKTSSIRPYDGNIKLVCNFVEKYLGTVRFGNDQFAPILGYEDLVQGNITVAFQKSTCFVRDLQGNDLITGNRGSNLYTISLQETTSSTPICFMAKASPTQAWLWHRRLSHLNFDYINLLSKKDIVIGLPKLKFVKDQLYLCDPMRIESINGKKYILNGVVERRNRTLVKAARTMLSASKLPLFFWAVAITTACYTRNISIIILTHEKTAYQIINDRKPSIRHLHIFGCTCYLNRDGENLDKMKERGDPCILASFSNDKRRQTMTTLALRANYKMFLLQQIQQLHHNKNIPHTTTAQSITKPITPTTTITAEENNTDIQAEIHVDNAQVDDNEFYNVFCTPVREEAESSSCYVDLSNMHTFYQLHQSEHRWTIDHPLSQVRRNPWKPVQTRQQLATDPEMCMFTLTVITVKTKNIKEAMANSAWIEAMQDELHQFDRLNVWELIDKPFGKKLIKLKWLWKNKKDEDQTIISNKA
ncbi:retrovirus-related pol polyprotein from transposon TNT 1-94 [Tanacetum coccineum]|uniref:Retrovirus-related pol polyprotein from transposon TNT 1-94 n=1 Tax=Tanacetum coccineum TaxID=301880 RepID=A0ABQ5A628_9ASTR